VKPPPNPRRAQHLAVALGCAIAVPIAYVAACSTDEPSITAPDGSIAPPDAAIETSTSAGDAGADVAVPVSPPPMPALGSVQLDRAGRALVNLALATPVSNGVPGRPAGERTDAQLAAEDDYNNAADPSAWPAYSSVFVANLKRWDGLEGTCGNSFLAADAGANRYVPLASLFVDDRLYLDTTKGTCATYLALERNAAGASFDDCGGRAPNVDAIDVMLTAIVRGFSGPAFGDGVPAATDATPSATTFPFLATSNP